MGGVDKPSSAEDVQSQGSLHPHPLSAHRVGAHPHRPNARFDPDLSLLFDGRPVLVSRARYLLPSGEAREWIARRHRKGLLQPHEAGPSAAQPPLRWLAWLLDARKYQASAATAVTWWVALGFTSGSALFCVSGVAGVIRPVVEDAQGPGSLSFLLIALVNVVAANLCFFPAGYLQIVESLNMGLPRRLEAWEGAGAKGPKPR